MPFKAFCIPGRMSRGTLRGPLGAPRTLPCELIRSLPRTRCRAESVVLLLAPPRPPLPAGRPPCSPLGPRGLFDMLVTFHSRIILYGTYAFSGALSTISMSYAAGIEEVPFSGTIEAVDSCAPNCAGRSDDWAVTAGAAAEPPDKILT